MDNTIHSRIQYIAILDMRLILKNEMRFVIKSRR